MKREIKFRGRNYYGMWMYGYLMPAPKPTIHIDCDYSISVSPSALKSVDRMLYEVETNTVGQFTGMKDKNGKEIYEGDIVNITISNLNYLGKEYKSSVYKCICIYLEDEARFVLKNTKTDYKKKNKNWRHKSMVHIDIIKKEVIGNIYDNPELLEG